jgi:FAD:protein FMN transferase
MVFDIFQRYCTVELDYTAFVLNFSKSMFMKMRLFNLLFACLVISPLLPMAQEGAIKLDNPSFEGHPGEGGNNKLPNGWQDCGFLGESPPDVHPRPGTGAFQVVKQPSDGLTYLGFVVRDNDTWEMMGQQLSSPLLARATYSFSIDMCRSLTYLSVSRTSNQPINYATPILLRIWGGNTACDKKQLLATSPLVVNSDWKKYDFELNPTADFQFIVLEAFYKTPTPFPYNGNILIDNASDIKLTIPAIPLTESDRHEFSRPLIAYHPDSMKVKEAVEKAYARVALLEKVFSDYDENSEVSWLAKDGKESEVSDELWDVLKYALEVSRRSEGAFDVSVGALSKVWRKAIRQQEYPSNSELNHATATVGYEYIKMKEGKRMRTIKLEKPDMQLDFGGIAVGYAVDEAMAWLREYDINCALVDGGGDILLGNAPPEKAGWEIDVPDKLLNGEIIFKKAFLANTAITTSGDTYRYLEHNGKRYSHIIDPRTGLGLMKRRVVTVTAPTCIAADAWSTATSVGISKLLTVDLKAEKVVVKLLEE